MTDATQTTDQPKRRGPKSRAVIEAEIREQVEAEMRAKIEAEMAEAAMNEEAIRAAAAAPGPASGSDVDGDPNQDDAVTIHFVEDGHTALGKVWFRGETLTLNPGTPNWEDAKVNLSKTDPTEIVFALMDEDQQINKWGKRIFRPGPWRGKPLTEIELEELTPQERAQLEKQQAIHEARYGK